MFTPASLNELRKAKNTPVAFSIMTSLAEGADRIVADTVLETECAKIEVILPLTKEDYLKDFNREESKTEFERLLKKDLFAITLRSRNIDEEFEESKRDTARRRAYFNAGKYIVDNCDVLLAIWDGVESPNNGGTYQVIEYARKNVKRPVIIINSTDLKNKPIIEEGNRINAYPIRQIDYFNSYKVSRNNIDKYVKNVFDEYFDKPHLSESKNFSPALLNSLKENLIPWYAKASLLAKSFKNRFKWTGQLTYFFSTLAVIILLVSIVFNVLEQVAFYIEFILLLFIFSLITLSHKKKVHSGWLEYRFLVERIRATPYFFLAGRCVSGATASSNSGTAIKKGQWAIMAFAEIWHQLNTEYQNKNKEQKSATPFNKELIAYVQKSWIDGQIEFQEKYFRRNNRKNKILETGGRVIFATAIAAALTHIIFSWLPAASRPSHLIHNILTVLAISLPTIAAAFEGLRRQSEYSRNKNRSLGMIAALETMCQKFLSVQDEGEFNRLLHDTDALMLSETQEWMMLMIPSELEYVT